VGPGAGCPSGQTCTSTDTSIGTCEPTGSGGAGGGAGSGGTSGSGGSGGTTGSGGSAVAPEGLALEGGGCSCTTPRNRHTPIAWALAALCAAALGAHRRHRRRR
jgi:MYXO-CTERM domain-containing protein